MDEGDPRGSFSGLLRYWYRRIFIKNQLFFSLLPIATPCLAEDNKLNTVKRSSLPETFHRYPRLRDYFQGVFIQRKTSQQKGSGEIEIVKKETLLASLTNLNQCQPCQTTTITTITTQIIPKRTNTGNIWVRFGLVDCV